MDIITGKRTYVLGIAGVGVNGTAIVVPVSFVDTAGNAISCNYFKVTAAGPSGFRGSVIAEVEGLDVAGDMVTNELSGLPSTVNASGICGVGFACAGLANGAGEWHGGNGDVATGCNIQVHATTAQSVDLIVEYGNLLGYNPRRADVYDKGL
jgi:hypothetical protein